MSRHRWAFLTTNDPTHGKDEVIVNLDNVLFIVPNKISGWSGSVIAFRGLEGENDLWVVEDLAQIKVLI